MANILLFFLSHYPRGNVNEIYYKYGVEIETAGHTNMGSAKALMSQLQGELHKVIYLSSDSVRKYGHNLRFQKELSEWAEEKYEKVPLFREVEVTDDFQDNKIMDYVISMIKDVEAQDCIYIDFAGGIRQAAFALLAMGKILKYKGVQEVKLLTSHYNREVIYSKENPLLIDDNQSVSSGIDYVGAVQYFLRTGDIRELEAWFLTNGNLLESECKILSAFKNFYNGIALCQAEHTMQNWKKVLEILEAYKKTETKTPVFEYVVDLFASKMNVKKEPQVVSLLNWCLEHDLMQQALTIYNEKMPGLINLTKSKLLYNWPSKVPNVDKDSYYGIYKALRGAYEDGLISEYQYDFKKRYLLLDAIRDHANHASIRENAGEIDDFLSAIGVDRDIRKVMSDLTYVKGIMKEGLEVTEQYIQAFEEGSNNE